MLACVQILHPGESAESAGRPEYKICMLACMQILHSGEEAKNARRPTGKICILAASGQNLHF
jgi:hypothetical protein